MCSGQKCSSPGVRASCRPGVGGVCVMEGGEAEPQSFCPFPGSNNSHVASHKQLERVELCLPLGGRLPVMEINRGC